MADAEVWDERRSAARKYSSEIAHLASALRNLCEIDGGAFVDEVNAVQMRLRILLGIER